MQKITVINCKKHNESTCEHCPEYPNDRVLPDENNKCSLCRKHEA